MHRHNAIQTLRDDPVSQRTAQQVLESAKAEWLAMSCSRLLADLEQYGTERDLQDCAELARLFESSEFAKNVVSEMIVGISTALRDFPLGQVPFRHQYQNGIAVQQLASAGNAVLSLVLYERRDITPPTTACFADSECSEIVLKGSGCARMLKLREVLGRIEIEQSELRIGAGDTFAVDGLSKAKQVVAVDQSMVVLRLSRTPENPEQSREYRLNDGALVHSAMGNREESRHEMFVTLLGAMGRKDAVPVFADIARQGGEQLRWEALRNCLALDSAAGFQMLSKLADDRDDALVGSAAALKTQLLAAHPQFSKLEEASCLA